jgi:5-methylcytosine-specific restriction protein A
MRTYLYTWNPNNWKWVDLQDAIFRVNNGEEYNRYWSCGVTKKIAPGDMFILGRARGQAAPFLGV